MLFTLVVAITTGLLGGIMYFFKKKKRLKRHCSFCSVNGSYIGIHNLEKVSDSQLEELLKLDKKIGVRVMSQNDKILQDIFKLGDGSKKKNFNYLAKQKLALERNKRRDENSKGLSKLNWINV